MNLTHVHFNISAREIGAKLKPHGSVCPPFCILTVVDFSIAVKNKYEALSNIDEEAQRINAESAWRIAKESYSHACECVPGKKGKEIRTG